jgi:tetratricopeptide (TPR) repeat protein
VAIITIVTVAVLAWWLRRVNRAVPFGLAWFALFLLPSSALFVLGRGEALAEHRVYLPSVGVFLAAGALLAAALRRARADAPALRWVILALVTVLMLQLGARTVIRNAIWSNPVGLWQESIDQAPDHWLPHMMLAETLRLRQGCAAAVPEYQASIRLRPQETFAFTKLGACLTDLRRYDEAAVVFNALVQAAPRSAEGPTGLAIVAMMQGHPEQSRAQLLDAIERDRSAIVARQLLATLEEPGDPRTALRLCQEIRQLAPATPGNDACIQRIEQRLAQPRSLIPEP